MAFSPFTIESGCTDVLVVVRAGALFTAVVPVTDLVAGREQTERRRDENHRQRRDDHLPRT